MKSFLNKAQRYIFNSPYFIGLLYVLFAFPRKGYFYRQRFFVQETTHIAIIRLSAMGDVAMSIPVIRALVKQHPEVTVTVVSKPFLKPLFDDIPNVSFVAAAVKGKHKGIQGLYRLYKELSKQEITHVADFHNVLRSKILRSFFKTSTAKVVCIDKGRSEKKALTRKNHKVFKQLKSSHQRYADVLQKLGFSVDIEHPEAILKTRLSKSITNITGEKITRWIGIAPFAAFEGKVYPLHLMEEVISELSSQDQKLFLFGGGEHEIKILDNLEKRYPSVVNVAGKLSFQEELQLISWLDVMLSMDSGNAHLAAMYHVKTITLWGVTHPYAGFAPYHQPDDFCILPDLEKYPKLPCSIYGNKVFKGYENVMESISPKTIIEKVQSIL